MAKNLDDDYDELTNPEGEGDDISYSLTPKGMLLACLMESETFNKHVNIDDFNEVAIISEEVWTIFENYTRKHYGAGENVAAIIFDTDGGSFNSIQQGLDEGFDDE